LTIIPGFGLTINGKHTFCGDFIYSGHTMMFVLSYLVASECKWELVFSSITLTCLFEPGMRSANAAIVLCRPPIVLLTLPSPFQMICGKAKLLLAQYVDNSANVEADQVTK